MLASRLVGLPASAASSSQRSQEEGAFQGTCVGFGSKEEDVVLFGRFVSEESSKAARTSSTTWDDSPPRPVLSRRVVDATYGREGRALDPRGRGLVRHRHGRPGCVVPHPRDRL